MPKFYAPITVYDANTQSWVDITKPYVVDVATSSWLSTKDSPYAGMATYYHTITTANKGAYPQIKTYNKTTISGNANCFEETYDSPIIVESGATRTIVVLSNTNAVLRVIITR